MIFCGLALSHMAVDISFPQQIEVRVNGEEVRANFKGLKNKPGTTKPVDITALLRKVPEYGNNVAVTHAFTTKVRLPRSWQASWC